MNMYKLIKKNSPFLLAFFMLACGGESAKEAKTGEKEEKAKAGKESKTYKVNKGKSAFQWTGRKKTGKHDGIVELKKGELKTKGGKLQAGSFTMDMTTIHVTDDMEKDMHKKLMDHLRTPDFFNVDSFPTAKFELTGVKKFQGDSTMKVGLDSLKKKATHQIAGNLTIKSTTKNVSEIPAWIQVKDGSVRALCEFSFDRTRWGIEYKSKSVLDNLKDGFIYDNVDLRISLHGTPVKKMAESGGDKKEGKKS
jgi:polyisoprenoid-binding protein YceI